MNFNERADLCQIGTLSFSVALNHLLTTWASSGGPRTYGTGINLDKILQTPQHRVWRTNMRLPLEAPART